MSAFDEPRFFDAGECALVIELGNAIDPQINDRVLALDAALTDARLPGVEETIPTFRSVMIKFDPFTVDRDALVDDVRLLITGPAAPLRRRRLTFPACYAPQFATDLAEIAFSVSMTQEQVAALHAGARYRVYMHGFAPGMAYLGGLPEALRVPRRMTPRQRVPANCLLMAAGQATIASLDMPSGWHILGQTAERVFVPQRSPAFLMQTGDEVAFEAVDVEGYLALEERAQQGEPIARVEALG